MMRGAVLALLMSSMALAADTSSLWAQLQALRGKTYTVPEAGPLYTAEHTLARVLSGRDLPHDGDRLGPLQWSGQQDAATWLLHETAVVLQGQGALALNPAGRPDVFIQAPHQYHDLGTGELAARLFEQGQLPLGFWNTAHRYSTPDSDLVHTADSYLHAYSRAFVQARPTGVIVQLHGFAAHKRRTAAARAADIIISNGTYTPSLLVQRLGHCLNSEGRWRTRIFPQDVRELGATTNRVAQMLRQQGYERFIHVEMAAEVRQQLLVDADQRTTLLTCLQRVLEST